MSGNSSVIIKPALEEIFLVGWERCRVILSGAPFFRTMCGMSMLTSMCLDYEATEKWYQGCKTTISNINTLHFGVSSP